MSPSPATRRIVWAIVIVLVALAAYGTFRLWQATDPLPRRALTPWEEHDLSFYDTQGRKISSRSGPLKMVLDPYVVYRNAPDQRTSHFSVNHLGFRGPPPALDRPVVAVLGGSAAFGLRLPDDAATFAAHLGKHHPDHTVLNAGVTGYLSGQELGLMVHHLDRYRPAAYLVVDGWNDLFNAVEDVRSGDRLGISSSFFLLEQRLAERLALEQGRDAETVPAAARKRLQGTPQERTAYVEQVAASYTANLDRMAAFARVRGAHLIVAFQPELGAKRNRTPEEELALKQWNQLHRYLDVGFPELYRELRRRAAAFCQTHGIPVIDLNGAPSLMQSAETMFHDPCHPNAAGHARIAEFLELSVGRLLFGSGGSGRAPAPAPQDQEEQTSGE